MVVSSMPVRNTPCLGYRQWHAIQLQTILRDWCAELKIQNYFSTVSHPQANGQVEATNKTLMKTLKKKLPCRKGGWVEYISEVLWSYWTTSRTTTRETPYSLTFGTESIILAEIGSPNLRIQHYNPGLNDAGINLHLDLLHEKQEEARIQVAAYCNAPPFTKRRK